MLGNRVLQRLGKRVGVGGAKQLEGRIVTMPGANLFELGAEIREHLPLVVVPVVAPQLHRDTSFA